MLDPVVFRVALLAAGVHRRSARAGALTAPARDSSQLTGGCSWLRECLLAFEHLAETVIVAVPAVHRRVITSSTPVPRIWCPTTRCQLAVHWKSSLGFGSRIRNPTSRPACGAAGWCIRSEQVVGSQSPWRSATPLPARLQDSHQNGGRAFPIFAADPRTERLCKIGLIHPPAVT
jgi:hypothetical protein